jgi:hypothetical protein
MNLEPLPTKLSPIGFKEQPAAPEPEQCFSQQAERYQYAIYEALDWLRVGAPGRAHDVLTEALKKGH